MTDRTPMAALRRDLGCPIMSGASDEELAADHGVPAQLVRELRDQMEMDALSAELLAEAREIARLSGSGEPLSVILLKALVWARQRTERAVRRREERRQKANRPTPSDLITGPGHSVGRDQGQPGRPKRPGGTSDSSTREIGTRTRPRWRLPRGAAGAPGPRPRGMRDG